MGLDDRTHDRQPQPDARSVGPRRVRAGEPLEQPWEQFGIDAGPVVGDGEFGVGRPGAAAVAGDSRRHRDARRRVHPGVAEQVADQLVQPRGVPADPDRRGRQVRDPVVRRGGDRGVVDRIGDELGQVDVFGVQVFAFAQPRQQQQLIDQQRHALCFGFDAGQRVFGRRRQLRGVLAGQFGISLDRRQRGAQLVAGVGDESAHPQVGFGAIGQCAVDVVQQSVERVPDDAHLVVGVGVLGHHPDADALVAIGERHRGDLRGGGGEPAQRAQRVADQPHGDARGHRQGRRDQGGGRDLFSGDDPVGALQGQGDDEAVGSVEVAGHAVGTQVAEGFSPRPPVGP